MNKTFKYRIYPTEEQKTLINKTIGCCRKVYNELLEDAQTEKEKTGKIKVKPYTEIRKKYDFMKEVDSQALNYARLYLDRAYKEFFKSIKGERKLKVNEPRKKPWSNSGSYTTYFSNCTDNSKYLKHGNLCLPKYGEVKVKWHRKFEGQIKHLTISRTPSNEYYVALCTEVKYDLPPKKDITLESKVLGIDMAMNQGGIYSDGTSMNIPDFTKKYKRKLAHLQRELSRRQGARKGEEKSSNFRKTQLKINRLYRNMVNERTDFLNKESHKISDTYDAVVIEDINLQIMALKKSKKKNPGDKKPTNKKKCFRFGKSIGNNAFGEFKCMLQYKLDRTGGTLVKAKQDKDFASSQICSNCGEKNPLVKDLSVKSWKCPSCGYDHNIIINGVQHGRDYNAAKNLKNYIFSEKNC
jgi:putative transposase